MLVSYVVFCVLFVAFLEITRGNQGHPQKYKSEGQCNYFIVTLIAKRKW